MIYVNDNYGHWHSDKSRLVAAFSEGNCPGRELVKRIAPREDDYFVIKPHISGLFMLPTFQFYAKAGLADWF